MQMQRVRLLAVSMLLGLGFLAFATGAASAHETRRHHERWAWGGYWGYPGSRFCYGPGWLPFYDGNGYGALGLGQTVYPSALNPYMNPYLPNPLYSTPAQNRPESATPGDSVIMNMRVPEDAIVYVNGQPTSSAGAQRRFRTDGLLAGKTYTYELRAEIDRNGQKAVDVKHVTVRGGQKLDVALDFKPATLPTNLTLRVPEGAKVFLGGNATRATGSVRHFATSLQPGETYSNYEVRVELMRDGKVLAREQTISLAAGQSRELSFDFGGEANLAANTGR